MHHSYHFIWGRHHCHCPPFRKEWTFTLTATLTPIHRQRRPSRGSSTVSHCCPSQVCSLLQQTVTVTVCVCKRVLCPFFPSLGVIESNQSLVLQRVPRWRNGTYQCQCANHQGTVISNTIDLEVKFAPVCRTTNT